MNLNTAKYLHELNNRFYQEQGESFAATRGAPWQGWQRCLDVVEAEHPELSTQSVDVLDLACGNRRFEVFIEEAWDDSAIEYFGVDNSDEMSAAGGQGHYQDLDILGLLIDGGVGAAINQLESPTCEIVGSFGFMHHIPGQQLRKDLLDLMIERTTPGGFIVVSFWQFLNSPELAAKAEVTHATVKTELLDFDATQLEQGDYFLGWQGREGAYRYCHSFSESEIDELESHATKKTVTAARFKADGRTGNLNQYLILEKN